MISVVIPTYDRRERLATVLDAFTRQDCSEPFEVIVISDGSTDGTDEFLSGLSTPLDMIPVSQPNGGPASARNHGVDVARSELVLFVDDDVLPSESLVRRHLEVHRDRNDENLIVIGPMRDPHDHVMSSWVAWEQEMLAKQYAAMEHQVWSATERQFYTGNASMRASLLQRSGGFDPAFRRAEDIELAFRLRDLGATFEYVSDAVGWHYADRTYESWSDAAYAYGRNDVKFARDQGRSDLYVLIADSFRRRQAMLRAIARLSGESRAGGRAARWLLELAVSPHPSGRARRRLVRYSLSAIYAERYYRGLADEAGSVSEFRRILRTPRPATG